MKENLFWAIFNVIILMTTVACAIVYIITNHWILAALYMVLAGIEGYNAYRHFTLWLWIRSSVRNSKTDNE